MHSGVEPVLCPFFGKCEGILILDAESGSKEFRRNEGRRTPECVCDLILAAKPHRLVCGYIGGAERRRLEAAGIDVRLDSCACPIDKLWDLYRD
jgi:hypothetical protein